MVFIYIKIQYYNFESLSRNSCEERLLLDKDGKKGQFFLCGSQQFQMMKNVSESLTGRLGIAMLQGLSMRELTQIGDEVKFTKFMAVMAARTGQLLNLSAVAGGLSGV